MGADGRKELRSERKEGGEWMKKDLGVDREADRNREAGVVALWASPSWTECAMKQRVKG